MKRTIDPSSVMVQISALIPYELRQQVDKAADEVRSSRGQVIRWALEEYFKRDGEKTKPGAKPLSTSEVKDHYAEQTKILQKQRRPKTKETRDYARKYRKR